MHIYTCINMLYPYQPYLYILALLYIPSAEVSGSTAIMLVYFSDDISILSSATYIRNGQIFIHSYYYALCFNLVPVISTVNKMLTLNNYHETMKTSDLVTANK